MQGTNCGCTSSLLKALAAQGADNPTADALGIVDIDPEFDGNLSQLASEAAAAQCPKGFTHRQGEFAARHASTPNVCCGCQAPDMSARTADLHVSLLCPHLLLRVSLHCPSFCHSAKSLMCKYQHLTFCHRRAICPHVHLWLGSWHFAHTADQLPVGPFLISPPRLWKHRAQEVSGCSCHEQQQSHATLPVCNHLKHAPGRYLCLLLKYAFGNSDIESYIRSCMQRLPISHQSQLFVHSLHIVPQFNKHEHFVLQMRLSTSFPMDSGVAQEDTSCDTCMQQNSIFSSSPGEEHQRHEHNIYSTDTYPLPVALGQSKVQNSRGQSNPFS